MYILYLLSKPHFKDEKIMNFLLDSKENIIDQMSILYRDNIFVPMCALLWMGLVFLAQKPGGNILSTWVLLNGF